MTTFPPTAQERRQFGDLASDIAYLRRGCHLTVAPFHGGFRVGDGAAVEVVTADGIAARAREYRARHSAKKEKQSASIKAVWQRPGYRAIQAAGRKAGRGRT